MFLLLRINRLLVSLIDLSAMSSLDLPAYLKGYKVRKKVHTAFMPFLVSGLSRRHYRLSKTFQTLSLRVFIEASIKKLGQLISPTNLTFILYRSQS